MFILCCVFHIVCFNAQFSHVETFYCVLEKESDTFDNFLKLLGDRIVLKGWTKFRGGLDAKSMYEWLLSFVCGPCLHGTGFA